MKKLLLLILLIPSLCFGDVLCDGVTLENVKLEYVQRILFVGNSITVGGGDDFTYNGVNYVNVGGTRVWLQRLTGTRRLSYVGQWGNTVGTSEEFLEPALETSPFDDNYELNYTFQPDHFGFSGAKAEMMVDAFTDLNQLKWFDNATVKDTIVIMLGTNDAIMGYTGEVPNRVVDLTTIPTVIAEIVSLVDTIDTYSSNIAIIVCQITPLLKDPEDPRYEETKHGNEWVVVFNPALETAIDEIVKSNLYVVDFYTPLAGGWIDGTYSNGIHPNNAGYNIMAQIIKDKMIEAGLL